jgi:hypothetical protein
VNTVLPASVDQERELTALQAAAIERAERQLRSTSSMSRPAAGTCLSIAAWYFFSSTTESSRTTL